ncbi:MAG: STAS domain-containing protein [Planctomycetes bacterium]|nr:STAS domain-containing protein [Planctomycetota bacterium]
MTPIAETKQVQVVRPSYDLVASCVEQFRTELQNLVSQGIVHLAIDLSDVKMIDSKGLAVFMLCHKSVSTAGGSLTVVTLNQDFRQLFHVMRMDEHFKIAESL